MNLSQLVSREVKKLKRRAEVVGIDSSEAVLAQIQSHKAVLHDGNGSQLVMAQVDGGKPTRKRRPSCEIQAGEIQMAFARPKSRIDYIDDLSDIGKVKGVGIETSHLEELKRTGGIWASSYGEGRGQFFIFLKGPRVCRFHSRGSASDSEKI